MSAESSAAIIRRMGERDRLMNAWIPIDFNDSPKGPVLVWNGEDILIAVLIGRAWYEVVTGHLLNDVTHWTMLPQPPREGA